MLSIVFLVLVVVLGYVNGLSLSSSSSSLKLNKYRQFSSFSLYSTNDKDNASLFASPTAPIPASMASDNEEGNTT